MSNLQATHSEELIFFRQEATLFEKVVKIGQYVKAYTNWLECLKLRQKVGKPTEDFRTAKFRNGLKMNVRVGTPDISILHEVLLGGAYASTERLIQQAPQPCSVIDLGANIGAFTVRCAIASSNVYVYSYEPGPQNANLLKRNVEINPFLQERVHIFQEAAAKETGTAYWQFDECNPGGSSLTLSVKGIAVQTRSFKEILARCEYPIALVKIDIEGSEYELITSTNKETWENIPAILTEVHDDPSGESTQIEWLEQMADFGFVHQKREHSTILLSR